MMLKRSGFGCHIGNVFLGSLAYADDLVLLSPTKKALHKLINICSAFAKEYNVLFNPSKSKWLSYDQNEPQQSIHMDGKYIERVERFMHLGNLIGPNSACDNLDLCINKFNSEVNTLMAQFGKVFSSTRYKLFHSYCMSFYGSHLWDF